MTATHANLAWLKVGVAIAVIKSKPQNVTAQEHATQLCVSYANSQIHMKTQYNQILERFRTLQSQCHKSTTTYEIEAGCATAKLTPSASSESSHISQDVERHQFSSSDSEVVCQTQTSVVDKWSSSDQCRFVRSVQTLTTALDSFSSSQSNVQPLTELCAGAVRTMREVTTLTDRPLAISSKCLCEGVRSVVSLFQHHPWLEHRSALMVEVCALVEGLLDILRPASSSGMNYRHQMLATDMLSAFLCSQGFPLTSTVLDSLVTRVESYCSSLRQSYLMSELPDPDFYDSGYFLLRCLDVAVSKWVEVANNESGVAGQSSDVVSVSDDLLRQVQVKLDNLAGPLIRPFPLVVHSLWKISANLESLLQQDGPTNSDHRMDLSVCQDL